MIASAYLVLTMCASSCPAGAREPIAAVTIPQPSMDKCVRQANAFNAKRKDINAFCVQGHGL